MALPTPISYADKVPGAQVTSGDMNEIKSKFNLLLAFVDGLVDSDGVLLNEKVPFFTDADRAGLFTVLDGRYPLLGSGGTNAAPTATVQAITGTTTVGQTLTGHYTYADAESNPEGASAKQWFRADNTSGLNRVAIAGATGLTYTLVNADEGKFIQFGVVPVASAGTTTGTQVLSGYTSAISAAPTGGAETVVFAENFANTSGVSAALSTVSWRVIEADGYSFNELSQAATSVNSGTGAGATTPIGAGYSTVTDKGFLAYANSKLAQLFFTTKPALAGKVPTKARYYYASTVAGSATVRPSTYVLAAVGSAYYVYDLATATTADALGTATQTIVTLDMATAGKWRVLNTSGGGYFIGAAIAGTLDPAAITAWGVYATTEGVGQGNNATDGASFGSRSTALDSFELLAQ